jgi:outer membrane protein TolC
VTASVRAGAVQFARRAEAGEESGLAARRVALAASDLEAQLAQAEAAVLRARAAVRTWRPDLDDATKPVLPELQAPPPEAPSAERPEVLALREEQRQAGFETRLAGRWFGFPELRAGWQRLSLDGVTESGPVLGFGWTVPLFDRNQAARAEAVAREDAARARLVLAEARARAEGHGARAVYVRLAEAAKAARAATEGDSRMVEAALAAYRAGEAGLTDLLDTLRAARDARLRALELLDAALAAHRDLEVALGRPLSDGGSR